MELFCQLHSHGEEVILHEEVQAILEGMDVGEAKYQAPPGPLSELLLVESWTLVPFPFHVNVWTDPLVLLQDYSVFMSGYILQMPCLKGDYKSLTLNFNWGQIKKRVGGYFFPQLGDFCWVPGTCLSEQAER